MKKHLCILLAGLFASTAGLAQTAADTPPDRPANNKPLWVIDGIILDDMPILDPQAIESIIVLKDTVCIAPYGEKGRNGVVVIRLHCQRDTLITPGREAPYLIAETMPSFQGGDIRTCREWCSRIWSIRKKRSGEASTARSPSLSSSKRTEK